MKTRGFLTSLFLSCLVLGMTAPPALAEAPAVFVVQEAPAYLPDTPQEQPEDAYTEQPGPALMVDVYAYTAALHLTAAAGQAVRLSIPMTVAIDGHAVSTAMDAWGYMLSEQADPAAYDQTPCAAVAYIVVQLDTPVGETNHAPLVSDGTFVPRSSLLEHGANHGYAHFTGLYAAPDAAPGLYTLQFTAYWRALDDVQEHAHTFTADLTILPVEGTPALADIPILPPEANPAAILGEAKEEPATQTDPSWATINPKNILSLPSDTDEAAASEAIPDTDATAEPPKESGGADAPPPLDTINPADILSPGNGDGSPVEPPVEASDTILAEPDGDQPLPADPIIPENILFTVSEENPSLPDASGEDLSIPNDNDAASSEPAPEPQVPQETPEEGETKTDPEASDDSTDGGMGVPSGLPAVTVPQSPLPEDADDPAGDQIADVQSPPTFEPVPFLPTVQDVSLHAFTLDAVEEKEAFTLPVAVLMHADGMTFASNISPSGEMIPYESADAGFDPNALPGIEALYVSLDTRQFDEEDFPFVLAEGGATEIALIQDGVNHGYAAFSGLSVKEGTAAGRYSIAFVVTWRLADPSAPIPPSHEEPLARTGSLLAALFGIASASAETAQEGMFRTEVTQAVILQSVLPDCECCVHCPACYDQALQRLQTPCACVDAEGVTRCQCCRPPLPDAPAVLVDDEGAASQATPCDCACHGFVFAALLAAERAAPEGWTFSTSASDTGAYLVTIAEPRAAIVFTYAQLRTAVMTDRIPTVHIGTSTRDNTAAGALYDGQSVNNGSIPISTTLTQSFEISTDGFVLDGCDPFSGQIATVQDNATLGERYVISSAQANHTYTFRNLVWDGANYYGIIRAAGNGTRLHFVNVSYDGPQMVDIDDATGSLVTLDGCTVLIRSTRGVQTSEEFFKGYSLTFTGADSFVTSTSSTYGLITPKDGGNFTFTIDAGTTVTLTTDYQVFRSSGIQQIHVNGHLVVNVNSVRGFSTFQVQNISIGSEGSLTIHHNYPSLPLAHYDSLYAAAIDVYGELAIYRDGGSENGVEASVLNVYEGGHVAITINGGTGSAVNVDQQTIHGAMTVDFLPSSGAAAAISATTLTVSDGGSLTVRRKPANTSTGNVITASNISLNNPYRVALYNASGRITSTEPTISTQCITMYEGGAADPTLAVYGLHVSPAKVWNNQGMGSFAYANGAVSGLTDGMGVSPARVTLNSGNLGWTTAASAARYAVVGQTALTVNAVTFDDPTVTGTSSGSETVGYQYALDAAGNPAATPERTTLTGGGGYTLSLPAGQAWARKESAVYVRSHDRGLSPFQRTDALLVGALSLDAVPDIVFDTTSVLGALTLIRRDTPQTMQVLGTNTNGYEDAGGVWQPGQWTLLVRQEGAFVSTGNPSETLVSAMVFVRGGNAYAMLGQDVAAATGQTSPGNDAVVAAWGAQEGIMLEQQPGDGLNGHQYTATLTWTLMPGVMP